MLNWCLTLLTARILSPKDYGIAALPGTVLPYLTFIATLNLDTWIVQEKRFEQEEKNACFALSLLTGGCVSILAFLLSPALADFYNDESLVAMFRVCSCIFFLRALHLVQEADLKRELMFKILSLINFWVSLLQGVFTLALAYLGYGFWSLVLGVVLRYLAQTLAIIACSRSSIKLAWKTELCRKAIPFGAAAAGASIFWILFTTVDDVVVGKLFGTESLGLYTMAYFFSQMPISKLQMIVAPILLPYYSNLKNAGAEVKQAFLDTSLGIVAIITPALIGLILVAPEAIAVILGEKWLAMVPALRVLCTVAILQAFTVNVEPLLNALGKPKKVLFYHGISAALLPLLFIVCGNIYGIKGVYWAWLAGYPVIAFVIINIASKELGFSPVEYLRNFKAPLISTTAMVLATLAFKNYFAQDLSPLLLLLGEILTAVAIFFGLMYLAFHSDVKRILLSSPVER